MGTCLVPVQVRVCDLGTLALPGPGTAVGSRPNTMSQAEQSQELVCVILGLLFLPPQS